MSRYAIIDLGTNTFHLLIVEQQEDKSLRELDRERLYVRLAEDGIGTIGELPFQRAMDALKKFRQLIDEYNVSEVRALGTAAMRTASNGPDLVTQAWEQYRIQIELIPGAEEARLIHLGVLQAIPPLTERMVIMDIGGGSVEFIIADTEQVCWSKSYPIGVAVLKNHFNKEDAITPAELVALNQHLNDTLADFLAAMEQYEATVLVGASGTFDVMEMLMKNVQESANCSELAYSHFAPLYDKLLHSTLAERLSMEKIPKGRADMIVVAMELIHFVLQHTPIRRIMVSSYAMKEGVLTEMVEG